MVKLIVFLPYFVGSLLPLLATSWRVFGLTLAASIAMYFVAMLLMLDGGGFAVLVVAIPITLFAVGAVTGHLAKAVVLYRDWPIRSWQAVAVTLVGLAIVPFAWEAWSVYRSWRSQAFYDSLPTADTLPDIPACAPFRTTGPLLDVSLIPGKGGSREGILPVSEVPIRYPARYMESRPPSFPEIGLRTSGIRFEMYVENALPAPLEDERDTKGRFIPFSDRRPSVRFDFLSSPPVERSALTSIQSFAGEDAGGGSTPDLELAPSPYRGLLAVERPRPVGFYADTNIFVAMRDGEIAELVQCAREGSVPFPFCNFRLDAVGIAIEGVFPLASISRWQTIRDNIRKFAECSVAAAPN